MKIMCLNSWGGTLGDPLIDYLADTDPDVLCLQEVIHTPATTETWLTYRDDGAQLPQRANLFQEVADALPDHQAIFCPAAQGNLWHQQTPIKSQWGLATFVRRSLPITNQAQGFVHGKFSADSFGAHPRSRSAHAFRLHDLAIDRPTVIAHMHGLRLPEGKHDVPERLHQAHRLVDLVQSITQPGDGIVVCGDFNVLPASATFDILEQAGLTDLVRTTGITSTRTSHYKKPNRFADYMLVNTALNTSGFEVVTQPEVSDHCPLILQVG